MRILLVSQMYPGPDDPDLGVFVAQGERALRERGHEIELAVLDRRAGGKARFLELRRKVRSAARPDVVWAHFLVPAGLIASSVDAPLVVTAHGRDVRNIGALPGVAALTRRVVERASDRDRRLGLPPPRARAKLPEARGKTEVVDSGVDLERFRDVARPRRSSSRRRSCRRQPDRAQERRSARRRVRDARPRQPHLRRRRPAARCARGPRSACASSAASRTTRCPATSRPRTSSARRR